MATDTKIEWADKTWNVVRGCERVSAGCINCYAERMAHRFSGEGQPYEGLTKLTRAGVRWTGKIQIVPELLKKPLDWKTPKRIFVNSMSDLFHKDVPLTFIYKVFEMMHLAPQHTYQILTKRPARVAEIVSKINFHLQRNYHYAVTPLKNVWLGVSCEDQRAVDERIPLLLKVPAAIRFVSAEPLLEQIDLSAYINKLDWVIAGAESGHGARPMDEAWVESLQQQCEQAFVKFFYKQRLDEKGKKVSLPVLNGRSWAEFPIVEAR